MSRQKFDYYLKEYTREIKEELQRLKIINDVEKQYSETDSAFRKCSEKLDNLSR